MKKQAQIIMPVLTLMFGIVAASPGADAKPNQRPTAKAHSASGCVNHKTSHKTRHFVERIAPIPGAGNQSRRMGAAVADSTGGGPLRLTPEQMKDFNAALMRTDKSMDLTKVGAAEAQLYNWSRAAASYKDALDLWPDNTEALYGLGQCAAASGDVTQALIDYRLVIYTKAPGYFGMVPGSSFQTNDVKRHMEFALLLNKTGQVPEALLVYNRAAALMDYERGDVQNGEQNVKVLLPGLALEPTSSNLVQYTPERLQALADTALAYEETSFGSNKEAIAHTQQAVKLFPDSPVTHYYQGEVLLRANVPGVKAAYQEAIARGDEQTIAAARERLTQLP